MQNTDEHFELRKRPKLNPVTKQEETIESIEITDTNTMVETRKGTTTLGETQQPSTSNTQLIEIQLSVEVSAFTMPADK